VNFKGEIVDNFVVFVNIWHRNEENSLEEVEKSGGSMQQVELRP
jgi:hypothetical protein